MNATTKTTRARTTDAKFPDGGKAHSEALKEQSAAVLAKDTAKVGDVLPADSKQPGTAVGAAASTGVGQVMDFAADAGMGMEGADKDSFAIPFIVVLQSNSPQCEVTNGQPLVPGAVAGRFLNSVTNEVFDEILLIPVAFQRRYLEWAPRSAGGGFKGEHTVVEVEGGPEVANAVKWAMKIINEKNEMVTEAGNLLKDTRNHFVMARNLEGVWRPAVFSLASTKISASKRWLSRMSNIVETAPNGKQFNPPSFSRIYKFWTVKKENDKGKFFSVDFDVVEPINDAELYMSAKAFYQQVSEGKVKVAQPVADGGDEGGGDNEKF